MSVWARLSSEIRRAFDVRYKVYGDAAFLVGDSPATHDVNTNLGRNGRRLHMRCDGAGDLTVAVSNDGAAFSDEWTMKTGEVTDLKDIEIDTVRVTHVADSAYRIRVW